MIREELETVQISSRYPKGLLAKIDARAERTGRSRNAWLIHALSYIIEELPTDAPVEVRRAARQAWRDTDL